MAGRALGTMLGQGDLGALAGEQLSKLFGFGDYSTTIKGNSLMAGVAGSAVPKFQGDGKRGIRVTEREFIGNILSGTLSGGSSVFTNQSFPIIPTDASTFPWLSKMAGLFDQWEAHGIVFEFHTTSSTFNGTSQALGAVIMATDYDPLDPAYISKQVMENADYACSSVPSSNLLHGIECDPRERPLEVMFTTLRAATPSFSSLGNFQIATQGCSTAGTTLGELWVSYDITFYKKQLVSSVLDSSYVDFQGTTTVGGPLLVPTTIFAQKGITIRPAVGVGTDIVFPPSQGQGTYLFTLVNTSVGASDSIPPVGTNCTISSSAAAVVAAGSQTISTGVVTITAAGASIRFLLKSATVSVNTFTCEEVVPLTQVA
jgi:hypothetical protein